MRKILLFILLLFSFSTYSQNCDSTLVIYTTQHEFGEPDFVTSIETDSIENGLIKSKTVGGVTTRFLYDGSQNILCACNPFDSTVFTYDANSRITSTEYYNKHLGLWEYKIDTAQVQYYYSSHGLDSIVRFNYDGISLTAFNKWIYSYNANDSLIQKEHQVYITMQWTTDTVTVVNYGNFPNGVSRIDSCFIPDIPTAAHFTIESFDSLERIVSRRIDDYYFMGFDYECNHLSSYYQSCSGCHSGYSSDFRFDSLCRITLNFYGYASLTGPNITNNAEYFYVGCSTMDMRPVKDVKICKGDSVDLSAVFFGGTGPYFVNWSPSNGLSSNSLSSIKASPDSTTAYIITVHDITGLETKDTVIVTVVNPPQANLYLQFLDTTSACESAILTTNSYPNYSFYWSLDGQSLSNHTSQQDIIYNGLYEVMVTLNINSGVCPEAHDAFAFNLFDHERPQASITRSCERLFANSTVPSCTYQWYKDGQIIAGATGDFITITQDGMYQLVATDSSGCASEISDGEWWRTISPQSSTNAACYGSCTGHLFLTAYGSTDVLWSNGSTSYNLFSLCPGIYTATITDYYGCTTTYVDTIGEYTSRNINFLTTGTTSPTNCDAIVLPVDTSNLPYNAMYVWEDSSTERMMDSVCAGWHTVSVSFNAANCTLIDSFFVPSSHSTDTCHIVSSKSNPTCFGGNNGSITIGSTTGSPYGCYWYSPVSNHNRDVIHSGLVAGTYSLMVIDQNGCVDSASITLTEPNPITATFSIYQSFCGDTCTITATPSGGTPPYYYGWCNGSNLNPVKSCMEECPVLIFDQKGCRYNDTIHQSPVSPVSFQTSTLFPSCPTCNDGSIIVNASGGNPPYTISIDSTIVSGDTISNVSNGAHVVCVTGSDNCSACQSIQFTIGIDSPVQPGSFYFYPNPFSDKLYFKFNDHDQLVSAKIIFYDMTGRVVLEKNIDVKDFILERGGLTSGVYIISVEVGGEMLKRAKVVAQ